MSEVITFPKPSGASYTIPDVGDTNWGQNVTNFLTAIPNGVVPTAGTFTLTGDLSLGSSFGLLSKYFTSLSANPASQGVLRLANSDLIEWRNHANNGNDILAVNSSDQLTFNGSPVPVTGNFLPATQSQTISTDTVWTGQYYIPETTTITINTGITLTIIGDVEAGPYPIFAGPGTVVFVTPPNDGAGTNVNTVYPEWFGATGNGSTDDTAAINAAILSLQSGYGRVIFTAPSYKTSSAINVANSFITLEAVIPFWRAYPVQTLVCSSTSATILNITAAEGTRLKNMSFGRSTPGISGSKSISISNTSINPILEDCAWSGSQYGLYCGGITNLQIFNCNGFDGSASTPTYGILIDGTVHDNIGVRISSYQFGSSGTAAVEYAFADIATGGAMSLGDVIIDTFQTSGPVSFGIYMQDGGGFSSDVILNNISFDDIINTGIVSISTAASSGQNLNISNVWMELNNPSGGAFGIDLSARQNTNISNVTINNAVSNPNVGIIVTSSNYSTISNAKFTGAFSFTQAIHLTSSTTFMTVSNCSSSVSAPLLIDSGCNNNSFVNNVFTSFVDSGTNNTMLYPTSGTFTSTVPLVAPEFSSAATHPAVSGLIRLGNTEEIAWRNAANSADLLLGVNSSNNLVSSAPVQITPTSNQLLLGTTNVVTLSSTAPSASRTYTLPDVGANANFILDQGNYTLTGTWTNATLATPILGTPQSGNLVNCAFPTLNQNTTGTAAGLSSTLVVGSGGTGTASAPTQYGVIYGATASAYGSTAAGTASYPLVANSSAAPTFQQLSLTAGVTGTLPVANGGTNYTGGAWTTYTPTVGAWTGSGIGTSTAAGRFLTVGKITYIELAVAFSGTVTATGIFVTLPNTAFQTIILPGFDNTSGAACMGVTGVSGANLVNIYNYTASPFTPISGHTVYMNGCYENT